MTARWLHEFLSMEFGIEPFPWMVALASSGRPSGWNIPKLTNSVPVTVLQRGRRCAGCPRRQVFGQVSRGRPRRGSGEPIRAIRNLRAIYKMRALEKGTIASAAELAQF
jgi:hypothetical protein